jgi:hypothetical protein
VRSSLSEREATAEKYDALDSRFVFRGQDPDAGGSAGKLDIDKGLGLL